MAEISDAMAITYQKSLAEGVMAVLTYNTPAFNQSMYFTI
jgi:hypothetical protein